MTHSNHIMVRIEDDKGGTGWGETTTFHSVYGYDQKSLYNVLRDYLVPAVTGLEATDLEGLHRCMDMAIPFNLMAKCGIDLAVHDLIAKTQGLSLDQFLGGRKTEKIRTIAVIGILETEAAAEKALEFKKSGFGTLKVKVGLNIKEDLERLKTIRSVIGDEVKLRVDANQGYRLDDLLEARQSLDNLDLEWLEQPLPSWDLEGLKTLVKRLQTPVAVDENIYTLHDTQWIHSIGAADVINIKVVKCGGIHRANQIARFCENEGLPWFLGGCIETSPGNAAHCHFYASTANSPVAVESGGDYYVDDIAVNPIFLNGDRFVLPEGTGIGVCIDEKKLKKYQIVFR